MNLLNKIVEGKIDNPTIIFTTTYNRDKWEMFDFEEYTSVKINILGDIVEFKMIDKYLTVDGCVVLLNVIFERSL